MSFIARNFRRGPRTLPSYNPADIPTRRSPVGNLIHIVTLTGSCFCAASLARHYLLDWGYSHGESMFPTIPSANSISITSPQYRNGKDLKVGDIVHAKNPVLAHSNVAKRVIGMPGDYVLRDENLAPTVGEASMPGIYAGERKEPVMVQVPEGHVWLAGDNMSRSRDSRFYGPVPLATIEGKVLYNGDGFFSWKSLRDEQLKPIGHSDGGMEVKTINSNDMGVD
jgi:mitochondrial inner membrane protease subunit 1